MGESSEPWRLLTDCGPARILAQHTGQRRVHWAPSRFLVNVPLGVLLYRSLPHMESLRLFILSSQFPQSGLTKQTGKLKEDQETVGSGCMNVFGLG